MSTIYYRIGEGLGVGSMSDYMIVASGKIKGDIYYSSIGKIEFKGISGVKTQRVPMEVPLPPNAKPLKAFLEVTASCVEEPATIRWRLRFDEFPLAREFKPVMKGWSEDFGYYSKVIYDITPIMSWNKEKHEISITYEGSTDLTVDNIALIIPYEVEDAETSYTYLSTTKILTPGSHAMFEIPLEDVTDGEHGELKASWLVPSRNARVKILLNGNEIFKISNTCGFEDVMIDNIPLSNRNILEIFHEPSQQPYYPRSFRISNIILNVTRYKSPKLEIKDVIVDNDIVKVKVFNNGDTKPDKALSLIHI